MKSRQMQKCTWGRSRLDLLAEDDGKIDDAQVNALDDLLIVGTHIGESKDLVEKIQSR